MREKVKVYLERKGVSVRGLEWTLWFRKVKSKRGETLYVMKPLEPHYNQNTQQFSYEQLKNPIWLKPKELGDLISALVQLRDLKNEAETVEES